MTVLCENSYVMLTLRFKWTSISIWKVTADQQSHDQCTYLNSLLESWC